MSHTQMNSYPIAQFQGGGRIASDQYRELQSLSDSFTGLEENTERYDLLLLVKRVGKLAGFTPRMIQLLDYYMAFTTALDWEQGSRPIVFQSLSRTAMDLGVTERQIQKLEKQLFELGAITWNDSGNHKRYGQRDHDTGRLLYAYGVELTPLAYLKPELETKLHEKQLYQQAWQATKREISSFRRQIRSLLLEWELEEGGQTDSVREFEQAYQEIAGQLRVHIPLPDLRKLLKRHKALMRAIEAAMGVGGDRKYNKAEEATMVKTASKSSCTSESKFAHSKYSTPLKNNCSPTDKNCLQESRVANPVANDPKLAAGLHRISLNQVVQCASERFRAYFPMRSQPLKWNDVIEAAYQVRADLGISQTSWAEACDVLGRVGAAVCVMLTDSGLDRKTNRVERPAAYFRGVATKAKTCSVLLNDSKLRVRDLIHQ